MVQDKKSLEERKKVLEQSIADKMMKDLSDNEIRNELRKLKAQILESYDQLDTDPIWF